MAIESKPSIVLPALGEATNPRNVLQTNVEAVYLFSSASFLSGPHMIIHRKSTKRHPQCQLHCVVPNRSGQCYLWISQPESKYLSWWSLPGFEGNVYLFWWRYRDWPLLFSLIIDMPFTGVYFCTVHFRGWPLQIGGGSSEHIKSIRMCWRFP